MQLQIHKKFGRGQVMIMPTNEAKNEMPIVYIGKQEMSFFYEFSPLETRHYYSEKILVPAQQRMSTLESTDN